MGWFGNGIYDGDETQTRHYDFIKWAKIEKKDDVIFDWLGVKKTSIPKDKQNLLLDNHKLILKKMPNKKFWDEDDALEWQMLLALYLDNNLKAPKEIYEKGVEATQYLIEKQSDDFYQPSQRRRCLRNFIKKAVSNNEK